ncbi:uncharacterized protein METZ01_LOCUS140841 [marine metagenome]|uniref:Uncharacterized protein n=1 Tax=marine metagenome TaxID=408172 RepID=A0A381ZGW4_9ZZZZ
MGKVLVPHQRDGLMAWLSNYRQDVGSGPGEQVRDSSWCMLPDADLLPGL